MTRRLAFAFLLSLLVAVPAAHNAFAGGNRIVALAAEANGRILALDETGHLWALPAGATAFASAVQVGQIDSGILAADLTQFSAGGSVFAAVTAAIPGRGIDRGVLYLFDLVRGGKPRSLLLGPGSFTGLVYDPPRNRILVAEAREVAILEAAPVPMLSSPVRHLWAIGAMRTIGPMVVDSAAGRLYCADPVLGNVYSVDLQTGRYTRIVQDLGEVRALCLNAGATHLFAADSARRRVWSVRLHPTPTAAVFAPNVGLREPTGLALDAAGNLWIADASPSAGAIYVVAPNGSLIRTLPR